MHISSSFPNFSLYKLFNFSKSPCSHQCSEYKTLSDPQNCGVIPERSLDSSLAHRISVLNCHLYHSLLFILESSKSVLFISLSFLFLFSRKDSRSLALSEGLRQQQLSRGTSEGLRAEKSWFPLPLPPVWQGTQGLTAQSFYYLNISILPLC